MIMDNFYFTDIFGNPNVKIGKFEQNKLDGWLE